jgi:hypothetical protein
LWKDSTWKEAIFHNVPISVKAEVTEKVAIEAYQKHKSCEEEKEVLQKRLDRMEQESRGMCKRAKLVKEGVNGCMDALCNHYDDTKRGEPPSWMMGIVRSVSAGVRTLGAKEVEAGYSEEESEDEGMRRRGVMRRRDYEELPSDYEE